MCPQEAERSFRREKQRQVNRKNAALHPCRKIPGSGLHSSAFFRASLEKYKCRTLLMQKIRTSIHSQAKRRPEPVTERKRMSELGKHFEKENRDSNAAAILSIKWREKNS